MLRSLIVGASAAALCAGVASAHITLERQETPVGASYKGVLRVPHGCSGSPTTAIRVRIPDGVINVKPMPKPGWTLTTVTGKYGKPYMLRGAALTEGVTEISWAGGKLADAHYDEFVFVSAIAQELSAGATIHFPVVQECEKGVHRWIDIPKKAPDSDGHGPGSTEPAPGLRLLPQR
jgi:uncharacterized protein YcnI